MHLLHSAGLFYIRITSALVRMSFNKCYEIYNRTKLERYLTTEGYTICVNEKLKIEYFPNQRKIHALEV